MKIHTFYKLFPKLSHVNVHISIFIFLTFHIVLL